MLTERLKIARKMNKLTQEGLAKKLKTTKGTISNYENGHSTPSNEILSDLADILGVSTDYLLGRTDIPTHNLEKKEEYKPLDEIDKILNDLGIQNMFFYDIDAWKHFTPEDVEELRKHFEWVAHKAKERNKNT